MGAMLLITRIEWFENLDMWWVLNFGLGLHHNKFFLFCSLFFGAAPRSSVMKWIVTSFWHWQNSCRLYLLWCVREGNLVFEKKIFFCDLSLRWHDDLLSIDMDSLKPHHPPNPNKRHIPLHYRLCCSHGPFSEMVNYSEIFASVGVP
jgi:hypothetical protein